jgi:hypothetical protein
MRVRPLLLASIPLAFLGANPGLAQEEDWVARCRRGNHAGERAQHCEERESRHSARATVSVDAGQNGGVSVEGWSEPGIRVRARVQAWAPTESEAREIARQVRVDTEGTLTASGPEHGSRRGWAVSWQIFVPRRTGLELETHNGPISVENVTGRMQLQAQNGPVSLRGVGGDVRARTQNGPVNVTLSGARWDGQGLDVETTNGPVTLSLPRSYSAELETGTVNGPMDLGLEQPIPVRGNISRRIRTTLGSGGPRIRAVTTNGPVRLRNS